MKIEKIAMSDIHPNPDNAKLHPEEQVEQIVDSIRRFGFNDPIAIDENGVIIEGHGRYMALQEMGATEAEVIRITGLNEEQKRAYTLIHNKLTMNTGFDIDILNEELKKIKTIDMSKFDFDVDSFKIDPDMTFDEDEEQDPEADTRIREPRAQHGQLWQLGDHRLIIGDSTDPATLQRLTRGQPMDLCLTDPPYNVGYEGKTEDALTIENDDMDDSTFYNFILEFYENMFTALKPGGAFYIFHADTAGMAFRRALFEAGGQLRQTLIWVKNSMVLGRQDYQWKHEPILYGWKGGAGHYFINDRCQTTIFEEKKPDLTAMDQQELLAYATKLQNRIEQMHTSTIHFDRPTRSELHPTMKPVGLCEILIKNSSRPGEKIFDGFGGSGSTLLACEHLGRACYTIELDPHYADVILQRWEDETGRKAVLIDGSN